MSKPLIILGGEGHGSVIEACINDNKKRYGDDEWEVKGFCNDFDKEVIGYPVLGTLSDIPKLADEGFYFAWGIHLIGNNTKTVELYNRLDIPKERLATIVHHSAFISESVVLEPGCLVMYNAFIDPRTHIGECTMIKANTCIGHDCVIGKLSHVAMGVTLASYTHMGICADAALGSTTIEHVTISDCAMLGAASLLTHDIPPGEIWVGAPARFLKKFAEV